MHIYTTRLIDVRDRVVFSRTSETYNDALRIARLYGAKGRGVQRDAKMIFFFRENERFYCVEIEITLPIPKESLYASPAL